MTDFHFEVTIPKSEWCKCCGTWVRPRH